ncbi:hypothetical protein [Nonomuraea guangzhouensis]|uniref:Uncharacterized protein n=1 Tax=Nonomuraea guangzhouensis TaxID=1291555 RepID=A0ABW4GXW0_9ACTN|nr:hypothetical protein [Nonomuraea guangzhouensis]
MAKPTLPVILAVGTTVGEIGTVELPLAPRSIGRDAAGRWNVAVEVDHVELRRRIADLLRGVADELEKVPVDGD